MRGAGRPAGARAKDGRWHMYHRAYFIEEHLLRSVAVETSGFVTQLAHANFCELAS